MNYGLPKILTETITAGATSWKVCFYDEFSDLLRNQLSFPVEPLGTYLDQKIFGGIPFLVGFFAEEKIIRLATPNAARELFLLEEIQKDPQAKQTIEKDPEVKEKYELLKKHIQSFLSLNPKKFPSVLERITHEYGLPSVLENDKTDQQSIALARKMAEYHPGGWETISDMALRWTTEYPLLRIHLLKLIAALPSLDHDKSGKETKRITLETLRRLRSDARSGTGVLPFWLRIIFFGKTWFLKPFPAFASSFLIRTSVRFFARRFIAGESIEKAKRALANLRKTGRDVTLDQLGELVVCEEEADRYCAEVIKLIHGFSLHVSPGDKNSAGIWRANVSVKLSALTPEFKPHAPEHTYAQVAPRLKKILLEAQKHQVFINVDAEHYHYRDLSFHIVRTLFSETPELKQFPALGLVLQTYLRDAYPHFLEILEFAKERGIQLPLRLVKGAYWDAETIEAEAHNFNAPQFLNKEETDLHFRQLIVKILESHKHLQLCLASHNLQDHSFAESLRKMRFPQAPVIEHQCLHGTYETLSVGMAKLGWAVRNYIPVGGLLVGMAYLVRRIMENSSQVGVLSMMRSHQQTASISPPEIIHQEKKKKGELQHDTTTPLSSVFRNVTPVRLYLRKERETFQGTLQVFRNSLGKEYDIGAERHGAKKEIFTPSDPQQKVGSLSSATKEDALRAIQIAFKEAETGIWPKLPAILRSSILLKAATLLLIHRSELASLLICEGGKSPPEALGDVDEAIDFLNFYSRIAVDYHRQHRVVPRGVAGVIGPWNFPLAIPCGMAVAPLAAGNTVLLKPADRTPLITQRLTDLLYQAGVPQSAFQHLPGSGREIGSTLVESPSVSSIVFTGSKSVGMWIAHTAGKRACRPPQRKESSVPAKVITEMGGKNAIIVTNNAELDETISGVLYSAFGHAGQKCSAASRILVDQSILEKFTKRFQKACNDLRVGKAWDLAVSMNPLIAYEEKERLQKATVEASNEALQHGGKILVDRSQESLPGHCMGPVAIVLPAARATNSESFAMQELFGPIVHIIPYRTREEAVQIANATEYALTGGVFSQSQDDIDFFLAQIQAGNIYVNRPITGARVAVEPFGGFKHSGTGPKAGSRQYIEAFVLHIDNLETQTGATKTEMEKFWSWVKTHKNHFLRDPHPNRKIPGQLSYDDYSHVKKAGLLLAFHENPARQSLYHCWSALALGARLAVFTETDEVQKRWQTILPNQTIQKTLITPDSIHAALQEEDLGFVIIDGPPEKIQKTLPILLDATSKTKQMISIHTPFDGPTPTHCEEYLQPFVLVRSCAINTMRYGAPLSFDTPTGGTHGKA